jgi:hypothetical protein
MTNVEFDDQFNNFERSHQLICGKVSCHLYLITHTSSVSSSLLIFISFNQSFSWVRTAFQITASAVAVAVSIAARLLALSPVLTTCVLWRRKIAFFLICFDSLRREQSLLREVNSEPNHRWGNNPFQSGRLVRALRAPMLPVWAKRLLYRTD